MANGSDNLIPFDKRTEEEQREIRSKGGKASGVARGFRNAVKRRIKENPETIEEVVDMLVEMSLGGDLKAIELLIELAGESAKQMEIKIKRDELKLRKEKDW
jgi:hypothetical protein